MAHETEREFNSDIFRIMEKKSQKSEKITATQAAKKSLNFQQISLCQLQPFVCNYLENIVDRVFGE